MSDLCLFAHYDRNGRVADYVLNYVRALQSAGFRVVVISTANPDASETSKLTAIGAEIILRENQGLDFGSWAAGLASLRDDTGRLAIDGRLLLANDSVYGPVGDLSSALSKLLEQPADLHCMVETLEKSRHAQSWFLLFSPRAYRSAAFEELFRQNFGAMPKAQIIALGEIGVAKAMKREGLTLAALASNPPKGGTRRLLRANPTHFLWRALIEQDGVPFLKVELLRDNPAEISTLGAWRQCVGERAPALLPLIDRHLATVGEANYEPLTSRKWRNLSAEAFVLRDDRLARQGRCIAGYANLVVWKTLLGVLLCRRWLLDRLRR